MKTTKEILDRYEECNDDNDSEELTRLFDIVWFSEEEINKIRDKIIDHGYLGLDEWNNIIKYLGISQSREDASLCLKKSGNLPSESPDVDTKMIGLQECKSEGSSIVSDTKDRGNYGLKSSQDTSQSREEVKCGDFCSPNSSQDTTFEKKVKELLLEGAEKEREDLYTEQYAIISIEDTICYSILKGLNL